MKRNFKISFNFHDMLPDRKVASGNRCTDLGSCASIAKPLVGLADGTQAAAQQGVVVPVVEQPGPEHDVPGEVRRASIPRFQVRLRVFRTLILTRSE